jgi:hypothetical protein
MENRMKPVIGLIFATLLLSGVVGSGMATAAQEAGEGFPLPAMTTVCPDEDYLGPFVGCEPWDGVTVSFVSDDGLFDEACVTSSSSEGTVPTASCGFSVPFGSTITVSIDEAQVPAGYYLYTQPVQEFAIPDGPPEGLFGGANFVIIPEGGEGSGNGDQPDNGNGTGDQGTTTLPDTGMGAMDTGSGGAWFASLLSGSFLLFGGAALRLRRQT